MLAVSIPMAAIDRLAIQPRRGVGVQAGKVQPGDGRLALIGRPEVGGRIGPAFRIPRPDQDDDAIGNAAVARFRTLDVVDGHLVVGVATGGIGHVDDHGGPQQPIERQLVDGLVPLRETDRRIDVGAAVLGREEVVGGE